jgi:hypothetical protein
MKFNHLVIFFCMILVGCTCKNEAFDNKKLFSDYVNKLGLSSRKIEEAILRLSAENFKCKAMSDNITFCTRGVGAGCVCGENQNIILTKTQQNLIKVEASLQLACL